MSGALINGCGLTRGTVKPDLVKNITKHEAGDLVLPL